MSELAEVLRSRGLRMTAQRQLVLDAVRGMGHSTPEQVHAAVRERDSGVNITTVYRTLELLEELGLVSHTHLSHGAPTYHDASKPVHVHLVCRDCGQVRPVAPGVLESLAATLRAEYGFTIDIDHVALSGQCRRCEEST